MHFALETLFNPSSKSFSNNFFDGNKIFFEIVWNYFRFLRSHSKADGLLIPGKQEGNTRGECWHKYKAIDECPEKCSIESVHVEQEEFW